MTPRHTKESESLGLRETLRQYRLEQAREDEVPPYLIFWDSTLDQLCEELPRDDEALSNILRFGGQETRDKYGEEVLKIIDDWVEKRLDKGLPLVPLGSMSGQQQGEFDSRNFPVPEDPPETLFGGVLGNSPWTRILWDLYESFCGANRKATKKDIGGRTFGNAKEVYNVLTRMKNLDFFDEDALLERKYMLDPTKPKVSSLIFALAELEGGHRSQEVQHRIKHLMKHRRSSQPDILVKIGDREIEMDAKKLIGFSSQIDSAIQEEMFDKVDSREILSRLESIQEMKNRLDRFRDLQSQIREQIGHSKNIYSEANESFGADAAKMMEELRISSAQLSGDSTKNQLKWADSLKMQQTKQYRMVEEQMTNLHRLESIVDTWQEENTRISTEDAIALTTQVLLEFSPDEDDGGPAWIGRADLFEQMEKKGFNGSSSRFSQILTKMVERVTISGRSTGEQGGREYRMKPDLWLMYRLLMEDLNIPSISSTPGHRPPI